MAKSERRLVVDVGTNSILALLADCTGDGLTVIFDEKKTTRLGEGLSKSGRLSDEAMERSASAIKTFVRKARYDRALLLGTEALRVASNSGDFQNLISERTGEKIIVLSGRKEAELNFIGALYKLPSMAREFMVIDVGGGSTEFASGNDRQMFTAVSIPLGASILYETRTGDTLEEYFSQSQKTIMDHMDEIELDHSRAQLVATGGTITSLAAMAYKMKKYRADSIHGSILGVETIRNLASKFEGLNLKERLKLIPFDPDRAALILPGAGIFLAISGILMKDLAMVSTGGLRFGAALRPEIVQN